MIPTCRDCGSGRVDQKILLFFYRKPRSKSLHDLQTGCCKNSQGENSQTDVKRKTESTSNGNLANLRTSLSSSISSLAELKEKENFERIKNNCKAETYAEVGRKANLKFVGKNISVQVSMKRNMILTKVYCRTENERWPHLLHFIITVY